MTARSTLRSLSYLLSEAWYALRSAPSALDTADGMADALAEAEAMARFERNPEVKAQIAAALADIDNAVRVDVAEPQWDCGLGGATWEKANPSYPWRGTQADLAPRPLDASMLASITPMPPERLVAAATKDDTDRILAALDELRDLITSVAPAPRSADAATERPGAGPPAASGHPTPAETHKQALTRAMDEDRKTTTATTEGI